MRNIITILLLLISVSNLNAQVVDNVVYTIDKHIPSYLPVKDIESALIKMKYRSNTSALKNILLLNDETTTVLVDTLTDVAGGFHESYIELYKGIKVEGTKCNIHYDKDGIPVIINGNFRTINDVDTIGRISLREGFNQALRHVGIDEKEWRDNLSIQKTSSTGRINTTDEYSQPEKVIYVKDDIASLTYKCRIDCYERDIHSWVYVDAMTGKVVDSVRAVCNITSNVTTIYSGQQSIESQYYNNVYRLRDYTRGNGIETYAYSSYNQNTNTFIGYDYTSTNSSWSNMSTYDRAALDVHWGVETTYDYYYNTWSRNSYDNHGAELISFVNINDSNAFWTGNNMAYGIYNTYPMVSLDVTAHELTHAFTQSTSALIYQGESGAINEGMSDVFATCVERFAKPNNGDNIWLIGEDIPTFNYRDMRYPICKYYHGNGWKDTSIINDDNGGVHRNSGVFSYWFYLLSKGSNGVNESGIYYSVDSIGLDRAIQICYLMNTAYLTSNSSYADACRCSYLAAIALGYSYDVLEQIYRAWVDVGVEYYLRPIRGNDFVCDSTMYTLSGLPTGATATWSLNVTYGNGSGSVTTLGDGTNCMVYNLYPNEMFEGWLTANIYLSGELVATKRKMIRGDSFFTGFYWDGAPYEDVRENFMMEDDNWITQNSVMLIRSDNLRGKNIEIYRNSEYNSVGGGSSNGSSEFFYEVLGFNPGDTLKIRISGDGCCNEEEFLFFVQAVSRSQKNHRTLQIQPLGEDVYKLVVPTDVMDKNPSNLNNAYRNRSGEYRIYNSKTYRHLLSGNFIGNEFTIDTSAWPKGIYIVYAKIEGEPYTAKILRK